MMIQIFNNRFAVNPKVGFSLAWKLSRIARFFLTLGNFWIVCGLRDFSLRRW